MQQVHHINGMVGVHDVDLRYDDSEQNFALDYGAPIPALPDGVTERYYEVGVRHALLAESNVIDGGPLPWPEGDTIIAAIGTLVAAKIAREMLVQQKATPTARQYRCIKQLQVDMQAVAPVIDIQTVDVSNEATWVIIYSPEATQQQRDDAQAMLNSFDLTAAETALQADDERVAAFAVDTGVVDLINRARTSSVTQIDTWLTNNVTTLAQARTVLAMIIKLLVSRRIA